MKISYAASRMVLLPAFIAVLALIAALWSGHVAEREASAATGLTVGLDMKTASGNAGTYNINSLPTFERCVDVKTAVNQGMFYIDIFVLDGTNIIAFNADIQFTSGTMQILEANVKQWFGTSSSVNNLSRNYNSASNSINPAVSDGTFFATALDTGAGHTGSGVLARIKGQAFNIGGGSVITFSFAVNPALSDGVTLTDTIGAHPGDTTGGDGLFDGPFINQTGKIAVNQPDTDGDGTSNTCDNCPSISNASQLNTDGDSMGDACDNDDDNDGVPDGTDNCPLVYNPTQNISACADTDGDGVLDGLDNCPFASNASQSDADDDGMGDACDSDDDNDGVPDTSDNCPVAYNPTQANWNSNSLGDACEESDGDGWLDSLDNCPGIANQSQTNNDTDSLGDICDNCDFTDNEDQGDIDGDFIGDACEDSDNDTWTDAVELFVGTDLNLACPVTTTANDESPDAWPLDQDDNRLIDLGDVLRYNLPFGSEGPGAPYQKRLDLNLDNWLDLGDVLKYNLTFFSTCTP